MKELPLSTKVEYLRRPETYGGGTTQVDAIETHMSWVFLTESFVYKLKKPLSYERLDYSTLNLRHYYSEEEVRLNRRLAEKVYLGTVTLTAESDSKLALNGAGETVDWLVLMHRLPESRMLDWVLARRTIEIDEVQPVAQRLAEFLISASRVSISTDELCTRLEKGVQADRLELLRPEFALNGAQVESIAAKQLTFLKQHRTLFDQRVREGRIIDGHGDLRPEHICLTPEPVIIDCIDFCQELRETDPADELAFLALECERLGQPKVGGWFIEAYEERSQERLPLELLSFYRNYRILRRAKIAAWHLTDPLARNYALYAARARRYLELGCQK